MADSLLDSLDAEVDEDAEQAWREAIRRGVADSTQARLRLFQGYSMV